jgi:beta-galactosidase
MRSISALLAAALLLFAPVALYAAAPAAVTQAASPRTVTALGEGWQFKLGEGGETQAQPGFDDSGWERVSVPHSWNRIGEYQAKRSPEANNTQGVGWYRLRYAAPQTPAGKRLYLDFGAVGAIADVWVNGTHVGQHKGAFSRFRFDVTKQWRPGAANIVAVRADNSKPAVGSSTEVVIPLAGDFFVHGGMYRGVSLITVDEAGIDLLDHGGPGIYARTDTIKAKAAARSGHVADISIETRLRNQGSKERRLVAATTIRDADGNVRGEAISKPARLKAGTALSQIARVTLDDVRLWDGRADPYLYTVTVEVRDGKQVIDSITQPLGIRSFRFDPNAGFFLNGQHVKLHGVSRHQDRFGKGWALTRKDHAEDMALIAEMGANTVRQAHYQHADEWSDEADKAGMVVWAEVPYVTTPSLRGGQGSPALWANAEQQLRELIRQNYNHPAIIMWSIGNEVDSAKGFGVKGDPPKPLALLQHLQKIAKAEDPTRPTTFADCCEDLGMMQTAGEKLAGTADLIGYNRYFGWYMPQPLKAREQLAAQMDKFHAKHPTLPMSISEYGAGGAISQHSDNIAAGFLNFMGRPQPEEFLSFVHEQNWPVIRERDYIFASWVWNMFDFTSDLREEGDSVDLNTKGLVTFDRKVKKDAFYYYKAQWNPAPMIHLTGKRYADRAYPAMDVKAYSNAEKATLTLNGVAIGETPCADRICIWRDVALRPGANEGVVTASVGGVQVTDKAVWNGMNPARGIRVDSGDLAGRQLAERRFGSDNFVTGGQPIVLNMGGFAGMRLRPPRSVEAVDAQLYDYWREGDAFSYAISVPDGRWTVTIHTFEPRPEATETLMTVKANGTVALAPLNVKRAAGGELKGISRSFPVTVKDGMLRLDFAGQGGRAVVAAIEVTK